MLEKLPHRAWWGTSTPIDTDLQGLTRGGVTRHPVQKESYHTLCTEDSEDNEIFTILMESKRWTDDFKAQMIPTDTFNKRTTSKGSLASWRLS